MSPESLKVRLHSEGRVGHTRPLSDFWGTKPPPPRRGFLRVVLPGALLLLFLVQIIARSTAVIASPISEKRWGISQECTSEIKKAPKSLDGPSQGFDGKTATCQRGSASGDLIWVYTAFEPSTLRPIQTVRLEISFSVSEWRPDDVLLLQATNDGASWWVLLEQFNAANPPPADLSLKTYNVTFLVDAVAGLEHAQIRLFSPGHAEGDSSLTISLDEAVLVVTGESSSPNTHTPTVAATQLPVFTATPVDTAFPTPTSTVLSAGSSTPTATGMPDGTSTPTSTGTLPPGVSPTITDTPTPTLTGSPDGSILTSTPLTPTLTPVGVTSTPQPTLDIGPSNEVQLLWGVEQICGYPLDNTAASLDSNFNDQVASCAGEFARHQASWQFTVIQDSSFTHISDVILDLRFAFNGWVDDQVNLEIYDGSQWHLLQQFEGGRFLPPDVLTTVSYPVGAYLASPEALNAASLRLVGLASIGQADNFTITVDALRLRVAGGYPAVAPLAMLPTPAFPFLAQAEAPSPGDPHGDHSLLTESCAACHRSHTSQGTVMRQAWPEESVCFSCHSSAGPGTNVLPAFTNFVNTATRIFTHDVTRTNAVHRVSETGSGSFSLGNRHIECEDCHDPHTAARGASAAPMLQLEMAGIPGIDPLWSGPGAPISYTWLPTADREYQVCFKCHSSFTSLPTYSPDGWNGTAFVTNGLRKLTGGAAGQVPDSRDLAREFNPNQASFHPVLAQGRNQSIPAASFVNGWSQTSLVYCTDCHANPNPTSSGVGPHGSPLLHILTGSTNYSTAYTSGTPRVARGEVCFQCHNYDTYVLGEGNNTNFEYHKKHLDNNWGTTCYTCHDTHGSEQLHLINFDASAMTFLNGRNSQTAWYYDPATGMAGCFLSCHGESHNPKQYTP